MLEEQEKHTDKPDEEMVDIIKSSLSEMSDFIQKTPPQTKGININFTYIARDNSGTIMGDSGQYQKTTEEVLKKEECEKQTYHLDNPSECGRFVNDNKANKSVCYAILMSLFEDTPDREVYLLIQALYDKLPQNPDDKERGSIEIQDSYRSLDIILESIGGEKRKVTFTSKIDSITFVCIGYPSKEISSKILENLWNLFPALRLSICQWILSISDQAKYRRMYFFNDISTAIVKLIELDFGFEYSDILNRLLSNPNNLFLLYNIIKKLISSGNHLPSINKLLITWASSSGIWLWKIPLLIYVDGIESGCARQVEAALKRRIFDAIPDCEMKDVQFISFCLHLSERLRSVIYANFKVAFSSAPNKKDDVSLLYLSFCYFSYFQIDKDNLCLPLVIFDSRDQLIETLPIILYIFSKSRLRVLFWEVLSIYLVEIEKHPVKTEKLKLFFQYIAFSGQSYYDNVQFLLKNKMPASCTLSKEISAYLDKKMMELKDTKNSMEKVGKEK